MNAIQERCDIQTHELTVKFSKMTEAYNKVCREMQEALNDNKQTADKWYFTFAFNDSKEGRTAFSCIKI